MVQPLKFLSISLFLALIKDEEYIHDKWNIFISCSTNYFLPHNKLPKCVVAKHYKHFFKLQTYSWLMVSVGQQYRSSFPGWFSWDFSPGVNLGCCHLRMSLELKDLLPGSLMGQLAGGLCSSQLLFGGLSSTHGSWGAPKQLRQDIEQNGKWAENAVPFMT